MDAAAAEAPMVAAIVLNWNGRADTEAAVASLLQQTHPRVEVFVVDNGSTGGDATALAATFGHRIRLIANPSNLGFSGGNNAAITVALAEGRARYVALLNNDAVAAPDWLERLVARAEANPDAAAWASHMVFFDAPDVTENAGITLLRSGEAIPRGRGRPIAEFGTATDVAGACGGAVLYRASALRAVGILRDDYFANFEDVDLSLRLLVAGHRCQFVPGAFVRHKLNASIRKVRDRAFRIRSLRNMTHAYWVNVPLPVAVLNLPWHVLAWIVVPLLGLLTLQWDTVYVTCAGRWRFLRAMPTLLNERRALRRLRRGSPLALWRLQRSPLSLYWQFFRDVVVARRRRYME